MCYGEAEPFKMALTYLDVDFKEEDLTQSMWEHRHQYDFFKEFSIYENLPLIKIKNELKPLDLAFMRKFA